MNLLDGTKNFSGTWVNLDSNKWTDDGTYKGLVVKKRTSMWEGIYKTFTATTDGTYTFSAYAKGTGVGTGIIRSVFINGVERTNLKRTWTSAFDWTRDSMTLNLNANDVVFTRYEISLIGTNSAVLTAGHKWEQASIATPYMPSYSEAIQSDYPSYIGTYTGKIADGQSTNPVKYNWKEI